LQYSIKAFIRKDGEGYIAECLEVEAEAYGRTLDETVERLRVAVTRQLDECDPCSFGLCEEPTLFITFEDVQLMAPRVSGTA